MKTESEIFLDNYKKTDAYKRVVRENAYKALETFLSKSVKRALSNAKIYANKNPDSNG
jgi:hypothetical protein